jgi:hypothetical protein
MSGLAFAAMQVSEAGPAVAFPVLGAVELGRGEFAIVAKHALCAPLLEISVDVLCVILPLVLLSVSNQVFV